LFQRDGVWYADARGGKHNLGKHSLATKDREEALTNLRKLDRRQAVELGLAVSTAAESTTSDISIPDGWKRFLDYSARPQVMGGVSKMTLKRYAAVRDKHVAHCTKHHLEGWNRIDKNETERYGKWLVGQGYADRTLYFELTLVKSVVLWLIETGHLPESSRFRLTLQRPQGTDTYCYTREQVTAMIEHCQTQPTLHWLANVIIALACTGLRISELASLRLSDIDFTSNTIRLSDERGSSRRRKLGSVRTTKGRRSRVLPINPRLRQVLMDLPQHVDGQLLHGPRGAKLKPSRVLKVLLRDVIAPLKQRFPTPPGEIGFEHGRIHSLRHFFVSEAFRQGATEGEVMEWVGHRDSKMVAHYRHLRTADSQRRMRQIDFLGGDDGRDDRPDAVPA
jgi:integrase